jgi:hypothetical protein
MAVPSFSILRSFASPRDPRTSRREKKHLLSDVVTHDEHGPLPGLLTPAPGPQVGQPDFPPTRVSHVPFVPSPFG